MFKKIENKLIKANWAVILEIAFLLLIVILKNLFLSKSVRKISRVYIWRNAQIVVLLKVFFLMQCLFILLYKKYLFWLS